MRHFQLTLETIKEHPDPVDPADPASAKDSHLDELISTFGRFQIINYVMLSLPLMYSAFVSLSFVFTASEVVYRCNISACDDVNSNYNEPWVDFTIPKDFGELDECSHYETLPGIEGHCEAHHFNLSQTVGCEDGYKFKDNEKTISTEFEIFCADQWKLSMVGTVSNFGYFLGIPLGGYLADRYGRKSIIAAAGILSSLSGLAQSNAPEYYSFLFFEWLSMFLCSSIFPLAFLLAMELVNSKHRVMAVNVLSMTSSLAGITLGYLAGYFLEWRTLLRVIYTPGLLHLLLMCLLPESVRWLLSQSNEEDAIKVLRQAARINRLSLSEDQLRELRRKNRNMLSKSEAPFGHYTVRQIFNALGLRIALCSFVWLSQALIEMGLLVNLNVLSGNKFSNFSWIHVMQLIGSALAPLLMNRIGRRRSMSLFMGSSSVLLVAMVLFDKDYPDFSWCLFFLAKISSTCGGLTLYIFTFEIFPTNCRSSLFSFCSIFSSIGFILAPQTTLLDNYYKYAPHLIFALLGMLNSALVMFFPETANKVLPTTLEEARDMDKNMPMKEKNLKEKIKPGEERF